MRIRKGALGCAIVLTIILYHQRTAWAQFASAIEGTISDSTGALVPGATVALTNEETGVTQNSAAEREMRGQEVLRANRELAAYFKGRRTEREARVTGEIQRELVLI